MITQADQIEIAVWLSLIFVIGGVLVALWVGAL